MRLRLSASVLRLHSVFGTTPKIAPPSHQYVPASMREISKSPTTARGAGLEAVVVGIPMRSAADQFTPAIEKVGGVFHQLAAAFEHLLAGFRDVFAGLDYGVTAHRGSVGDVLPGVFTRLGRIQDGDRRADDGSGEEPGKPARPRIHQIVFIGHS